MRADGIPELLMAKWMGAEAWARSSGCAAGQRVLPLQSSGTVDAASASIRRVKRLRRKGSN